MRYLFLILLIPGLAIARPVTIEYAPLDPIGCDGEVVIYTGIEIFVDIISIPASDSSCEGDGIEPDVAPPGVTPIPGEATGGTTATFDLAPGTYFIRMWATATDGHSQLSNERIETVPEGLPQAPFVIDITF